MDYTLFQFKIKMKTPCSAETLRFSHRGIYCNNAKEGNRGKVTLTYLTNHVTNIWTLTNKTYLYCEHIWVRGVVFQAGSIWSWPDLTGVGSFSSHMPGRNKNMLQSLMISAHSKIPCKDGSWNWGLFAHRENSLSQPKHSIQLRTQDLSSKLS